MDPKHTTGTNGWRVATPSIPTPRKQKETTNLPSSFSIYKQHLPKTPKWTQTINFLILKSLDMIGTLTNPLGGTTLGFTNDTRLSPVNATPKVHFRRQNRCNALLHVTEEVVDSMCKTHFSLYEVLRVKCNATPNEIKTAYRNLAKIYHPDASDVKQHDDDLKFIEIHNAYATLHDPVERAMYDVKLKTRLGRRSGSLMAGGKRWSVYTCRRWETDQCW